MTSLRQQLAALQRRLILAALRRARGCISLAARELGLHRNSLIYKCNVLGIDPSAFWPHYVVHYVRSATILADRARALSVHEGQRKPVRSAGAVAVSVTKKRRAAR